MDRQAELAATDAALTHLAENEPVPYTLTPLAEALLSASGS